MITLKSLLENSGDDRFLSHNDPDNPNQQFLSVLGLSTVSRILVSMVSWPLDKTSILPMTPGLKHEAPKDYLSNSLEQSPPQSGINGT